MAKQQKVGFIGLGIMGSLQAMNLAKAGYELTVFNRTREKAEAWVAEHGGTVADSPREVAEASDVVITMVVDGAAGRGHDRPGAAGRAARTRCSSTCRRSRPGRRASSTSGCAQAGHAFVDAPVTGSSPKAKTGTLTIMCGGAEADIERARPLFEIMGEKIVLCGEAGQGQAVKVISQAITAVNCATLAQGLVLARQAGVDVDALLQTMDGGSSDSTMRALKGKPMLEHDFTPLFKLAHMLKDVQLCLAEARTAGGRFPFAGLAAELYGAGIGTRPRRPGFRRRPRSRRGPHWYAFVAMWRVAAHRDEIVSVVRKTCLFPGRFCDFSSLCIVCDASTGGFPVGVAGRVVAHSPCAGTRRSSNSPFTHLYADRFQGMGRHRARSRRR